MKKTLIIAIIAISGIINAQKSSNAKFGIRGGLNLSNFTGAYKAGDVHAGVNIGLFTEVKISNKLAFQPELNYSMQGATESNASMNLNYITIPALLKIYPVEKFDIEFGPQIGFLTSATIKYGSASVDASQLFNSTDFGLNFGFGFDASKKVNLGFRYYAGLTNVFSTTFQTALKSNGMSNTSTNNSVVSINLAYKF